MRSRARHWAFGFASFVALAGCSPLASAPSKAPGATSAADSGWIDPSTPVPRAKAVKATVAPWDLRAQLALARPVIPRVKSGHMTGELEADVLAVSAGTYPVLGPEIRMPVGATLIERGFQPGGAEPVAFFAMVKRAPGFDPPGGDWEYVVLSASGQTEQRGALPLCARCHAEAPHDRLFGRGR